VDELNVFLSSGEVQNAAVSIEFAKVKTFQGKIFLFYKVVSTTYAMLLSHTLYF